MSFPVDVSVLGSFKGKEGEKGDTGSIAYAEGEVVGWDQPFKVEMIGPESNRGARFEVPLPLPGPETVNNDDATELLMQNPTKTRAAAFRAVASRLVRVNVRDHGAAGNSNGTTGGTDDNAAIVAAIAAAVALGANTTLWFPAVAVGYRSSATIDIPGSLNVLMESPIVYTGAAAAAVRYNPSGGRVEDRDIMLRVRRGTQSPWDSENDRGVTLRNVQKSRIALPFIDGFCIGAQLVGDGSGLTGNQQIILGRLSNNKIDIDLNAMVGGWVNDNLFIGGYASVDSLVNTGVSRVGVRIRNETGYENNANIFDKLIVEKGVGLTGGAESVCALIIDGIDNEFRALRNESNTVVARTQGKAQNNKFMLSYSTSYVVEDQGLHPTTDVKSLHRNHLDAPQRPVWSLQDLGRRAVMYDATQVNVPGAVFFASGGTTPFRQLSGPTIEAGFLDCKARQLGVFISTTKTKNFLIQVDAVAGRGGRLSIRCYDAAGVLMNPADHLASPLVKGVSGAGYAIGGGQDYTSGSDTDVPRVFRVAASVASIAVCISPGSLSAQLRSITISTPDLAPPTVWTGFPENEHDAVAVQAPTGTYTVGRRANHGAPAVGQPIGWVCTAPTTWRALANLA